MKTKNREKRKNEKRETLKPIYIFFFSNEFWMCCNVGERHDTRKNDVMKNNNNKTKIHIKKCENTYTHTLHTQHVIKLHVHRANTCRPVYPAVHICTKIVTFIHYLSTHEANYTPSHVCVEKKKSSFKSIHMRTYTSTHRYRKNIQIKPYLTTHARGKKRCACLRGVNTTKKTKTGRFVAVMRSGQKKVKIQEQKNMQ